MDWGAIVVLTQDIGVGKDLCEGNLQWLLTLRAAEGSLGYKRKLMVLWGQSWIKSLKSILGYMQGPTRI